MSILGKSLRWIALGLLATVLLVTAFVLWIANTQRGTTWVAGVISNTLGDRLSFDRLEGALAGPLTLKNVHYRDPATGLDVSVERVMVDLELLALARMTIQVRDAEVQGINLVPGKPQPAKPASEPFSIEPPIDIIVNRFALRDAAIRRADQQPLAVNQADLIGSWTDAGIVVKRLYVLSPQGEVHFIGHVSRDQQYAGNGRGRFRWQAGDFTYAGNVVAETKGQRAQIALQLNSPLNARLDASIAQTDLLPWQFVLEVPRFDPRETLMPDTSMQVLAASFRGDGSRDKGKVTGELIVDDVSVRVDPLQFVRGEDRIALDPLILRLGEGEGALEAKGEVLLAQQPLRAQLDMNWRDLVIPARLAGQELRTRGTLRFSGSTESFAANGQLAIGPPTNLVDISFDLEGTPQMIEIKQLALIQSSGQLTAQGNVELKPRIGWQLQSQAREFNPGALAVEWPGKISFALNTQGRMSDTGPDGTLELKNLRGRLRGRPISGQADLTFTAQPTLAGTLALQSGGSRIDVRGNKGDAMQATAMIDVRNLGDWMPDAQGSLNGRVTAQGRWPKLEIKARSGGKDLRVADAQADALSLNLAVLNPKQPSGSVHVELDGVAAAGFEFASLRAQASGDQKAHTLELTASGDRLGGEVRIDGSQTGEGWSGSIERLILDVPKVARFALQSPARAAFSKGAVTLQQTCLADGDIRLCAALDRQADGALEASYSLDGVQLSLANTFVPDLPVAVSGVIEGNGNIRRTAAGELYGEARIALPAGRIASAQMPEESLMEYSDLRVAADLAGADARATLSGRFGNGGQLDGSVSLAGLGQVDTAIDGNASAVIPTLAPIAVFVPQLADVQGRADMHAKVGGTLQAPEISGELRAIGLAAQVPELGLKLTNGRVRAMPESSGNISIDGEVQSGKGKLSFGGVMTRGGHVRATVEGKDFLAADIPAAHVIAAPDLVFTRDEKRMSLTGKVRVPSASVDLKKLPKGGPQKASPDVVVIDEVTRENAAAMPLYADITVILGDDVELAGFGLQAKVNGELAVKETPGTPTTGSGDINVAGTYKAYGQDLTIQRGQLLFAGTPLDDPRLSIAAVRKVDEITAGLRVEGTAKNPQLSVFSDPSMSQAETLSYLVTGRPLDSIGSSQGDGDALQSAARSLGTAGGGLLAKSIGGRLGVDEVGVEDNELIGGSAFTVGEYLSPRLYLSYGVGLFEPGEVISLRYRLSDELSLQTARGPNETRAGVEYRIER